MTDHFSVPSDEEDTFFNAFNLTVRATGEILPRITLTPDQWYTLTLEWDTDQRRCRLVVDERDIGVVQDTRRSRGLNYLRLRSIATQPDAGLVLRRVTADVSASWPDN